MKKIMFWGDSPTAGTGFGNVLKFIIKHLPREQFDISVLGIYYDNTPHDLDCRIYPVKLSAELHDKKEIHHIIKSQKPDIIFILSDIWVIDGMLLFFKEYNIHKKTKIVAYMPVDAKDHNPDWYKNVKYIDKLVVYNKFGQDVVKEACPSVKTEIIEHGVDSEVFYKLPHSKQELRKIMFPDSPELDNSFIFLNAGRNQPRKTIDISMRAFAEFAKGKSDVYLYMHCGSIDMHIDVLRLGKILGIDDRIIMSTSTPGLPNVPIEKLNMIYNFCDAGLNSGLGEGFGLPNAEQAAVGKPQIVPDHSALTDLYSDCGLLVPAKISISLKDLTTTARMILPEDMAQHMDLLYSNKEVYNNLAIKSQAKFNSPQYSWKEIAKQWSKLFNKL